MTPDETHELILARLRDVGADYVLHQHATAITVEDAVRDLPFPVKRFLKTVAFRVRPGGWVLASVQGRDGVDYKRLAAALGVKRGDIVRPIAEEVEAGLGVEMGGVGPVPTVEGTRVVIDTHYAPTDRVFCGSGRADRTLEVTIEDLVRAAGATVADIAKRRAEE